MRRITKSGLAGLPCGRHTEIFSHENTSMRRASPFFEMILNILTGRSVFMDLRLLYSYDFDIQSHAHSESGGRTHLTSLHRPTSTDCSIFDK